MKISTNILRSTGMALLFVSITFLTMMVGGDFAGGVHYDPHTLRELREEWPSFLFTFVLVFSATFFYNSFNKNRAWICPACEHPFMLSTQEGHPPCPLCAQPAEPAEGFYERHSELKDTRKQQHTSEEKS